VKLNKPGFHKNKKLGKKPERPMAYGAVPRAPAARSPREVHRQVLAAVAVSALALAVCCALIAAADLGGARRSSLMEVVPAGFVVAPRRSLYGLGAGEEQDAENHAALAFGTFSPEYADELLGEDHYAAQFLNALHSDEVPRL